MYQGAAALFYLEWRQAANRLRTLLRAPGRLAIYVVALGYMIFIAVLRSRQRPGLMHVVAEPYASALFCAYVVLLGVLAYGGASGIAGAFSSPADARFVTASAIPERLVVLWLQCRRAASGAARSVFTLLFYTVIFGASGRVAGIAFCVAASAAAASAVAIPMLKLRTVLGAATAQSAAAAIVAIGFLPLSILLSSLVSPALVPAARGVEHLGLGAAFNAAYLLTPVGVACFSAAAAALLVASFAYGGGLYPELYTASIRTQGYRERLRRGGTRSFNVEHVYRSRAVGAGLGISLLRGAWTIAWKEWVGFARSPSMQRLFALGAVACTGAGIAFGRLAAQSRDPGAETVAFGSMAFNLVVIYIAMGSAMGLAADLRRPLWWIGRDPLWIRLLAWIVGTSWRLAACFALAICSWCAAIGRPAYAAGGIVVAAALVLYLRAVGLALYALFPATLDQRGPLAMLRALVTYLLAAPPVIAAVVCAFLLGPAAAFAAGIGLGIAETSALLAFAAWRIAGRGVAFAQAEST